MLNAESSVSKSVTPTKTKVSAFKLKTKPGLDKIKLLFSFGGRKADGKEDQKDFIS